LLFLREFRDALEQNPETLLPMKNSRMENLTRMTHGSIASHLPMEQIWKARDEQACQWDEEYQVQYNQ